MTADPSTLRSFVAEAFRDGDKITAVFGFPGGRLDYVLEPTTNRPRVYTSTALAESDARRVLLEALNARSHIRNKATISRKMSNDEFAAALGDVGIGPAALARLWGTKQSRVMDMISGVAEVPFPMRWVLVLLRDPKTLALVTAIADQHTEDKEP